MQSAMLMLLVLGFIALGVEISQLLLEQRKQQSVADSAAMAAASAVNLGVTDLQAEARAVTAELGYRNGVGGVTVTAAKPPSAGPHAGDTKYVEVKVQRAFTPALIQLFRQGSFTVQARSVAKAGQASPPCIMALNTSGMGLELENAATLTTSGCGVMVNASGNSAASLKNNATVNGDVKAVGTVTTANSATINGTVTNGAAAGANPYASLSPTSTGLLIRNSNDNPLQPGIYDNGLQIQNAEHRQMLPGTYYIRSKFIVKNNATLTGSGVNIVLDGNFGMNIENSATLNLTAATIGIMPNVLFYTSPINSSGTQKFMNNSTLNLTGALYFPNQTVEFLNSAATTNAACIQLVAGKIHLAGNSNVTLKSSCSGGGGSSTASSLAE